jgi:hypothetical protein
VALEGGVDGASIWCFDDPGRAGVGDVARYISRFASSSPVFPSRAAPAALKPLWRRRAERATSGGGVRGARGGESRRWERLIWKEVMGRSSSSSSDRRGERRSGTVEVSETKDRLGTCVRPKRACRRWYTGDDSGSWKLFFQLLEAVAERTLLRVWLLEAGYLDWSYRGRLFWLWLLPARLPERRTSSENIGAASGEESRTEGW